jgi:hypothetical protein
MLQAVHESFDDNVDDLIGGTTDLKTIKKVKKSDKKVQKKGQNSQEESKKTAVVSKKKKIVKESKHEEITDKYTTNHVEAHGQDEIGQRLYQADISKDDQMNLSNESNMDELIFPELKHAFQELEKQYNDLKLVGILEAEKRFDEFKDACDVQIQGFYI